MDSMKLCPKCGYIADYNYYFGAYICNVCNWKDDSYNKERIEKKYRLRNGIK